MKIQFPVTVQLTIEEAEIVHKALTLFRAENLSVWPAMPSEEQVAKVEQQIQHAATMAKELGDHIEHYQHLEQLEGAPNSQYQMIGFMLKQMGHMA